MGDRSAADIARTTELLRKYFDNDLKKRFDFERYVGGGAHAVTWKMKYKPHTTAPVEHMVVKTEGYIVRFDDDFVPEERPRLDPDDSDSIDFGDDDDDADMWSDPIGNERKWLKMLMWAKHIIRLITVPKDPLRRKIRGIRPHHAQSWIYLEWVENGTLKDFFRRAREEGVERLPNRLLWRFFMCLIRMCIAMGWPPAAPADGTTRLIERVGTRAPRRLMHNDMHDENVMIGPFIDDDEEEEHDIAPILKLIDFGSGSLATERSGGGSPSDMAVKDNIHDIASIMVGLVRLNSDSGHSPANHFPGGKGAAIQTLASGILPDEFGNDPCPGLDEALRNLICLCRATAHDQIPGIRGLSSQIMDAIEKRDQGFYNGDPIEEDGAISALLKKLLMDGQHT